MSDLNKLLEDLSILIFEADKSIYKERWSTNFEDYEIFINSIGKWIGTRKNILDNRYRIILTRTKLRYDTVIMHELNQLASPDVLDKINKALDKILLLQKIESLVNE